MVSRVRVAVQDRVRSKLDPGPLRLAAKWVAAQEAPGAAAEVTIVLTDSAAVAELNRQFRGIDAPTDILSFPSGEQRPDAPEEPWYLGDLVIALDYASAQAAKADHDLVDSLSLLVIHGMLHLFGYDHGDTDAKRRMWAAQEAALRELGLPLELAPGLEALDHGDA